MFSLDKMIRHWMHLAGAMTSWTKPSFAGANRLDKVMQHNELINFPLETVSNFSQIFIFAVE